MTGSQTTLDGSASIDDRTHSQWSALRPRTGLRDAVAALSFWTGIVIPAVYLPLLFYGIESIDGLAAFLTLFGLHVVALLGGRCHLKEPTA